MGSEESESVEIQTRLQSDVQWGHGALAGFVASLAMALVIGLWDATVLRDAIAALYQQEGNLVVGVLTHVIHGTLFGVLFALILSDPGLYHLDEHTGKSVLAGVVYGLALALFGAGIIMPIWLNSLGSQDLPMPYITGPLLVWHLVYGTVLGLVYTLSFDR